MTPTSGDVRSFPATDLERLVGGIFVALGAPDDVAKTVSELLVTSERMGHPSHGVLRVTDYVRRIEAGTLIPGADCVVAHDAATSALVDGGWGFGQIAALRATRLAIQKASECGVAASGAFHLNHVGRLGDFTEMAAREGMIAFAFVGGTPSGRQGNVAPYGGRQAVWGTNPLAVAIPGEQRIFSLDFATSVIAGGKVMAAHARGEMLDDAHLLDSDGRQSSDPNALFTGGAIRPFGGHKGYGLAFAVELLAGALIGTAAPDLKEGEMQNGLLMMVLDPGAFDLASSFRGAVDHVIERVKASPPAEGFEEVLFPGELEQRRLAGSAGDDVRVPESVAAELEGLFERLASARA
jgi:LDH2 family malate/lactate/ureidoglycolate dehydrogenase